MYFVLGQRPLEFSKAMRLRSREFVRFGTDRVAVALAVAVVVVGAVFDFAVFDRLLLQRGRSSSREWGTRMDRGTKDGFLVACPCRHQAKNTIGFIWRRSDWSRRSLSILGWVGLG